MKLIPDRSPRASWVASLVAVSAISVRARAADAPAAEYAIPEPPPGAAAPEPPPPAPVAAPAPPPPAPAVVAAPPVVQSIHPALSYDAPSGWYGWQTLATDGTSLALVIGSIALAGSRSDSPSAALGWGALGTYALGAPVLHLVHRNPGRAFASLGMRVGGPIALGALGAAAEDCANHGGDFCGLGGALIGATLGIVAAVTIDAAVFAYDDAPEGDAAVPRFQLGLSRRGLVAFGTF